MTNETDFWNLIATGREGVLSTINRGNLSQLSNVLYLAGNSGRTVRISTTADRLKARNLARDPRAVLHVSGDNFWAYAVAEGRATLTAPAAEPGDNACRELLEVHSAFYGPQDEDEFFAEMIARQRLVIRLGLDRVYGVIASGARRPLPVTGEARQLSQLRNSAAAASGWLNAASSPALSRVSKRPDRPDTVRMLARPCLRSWPRVNGASSPSVAGGPKTEQAAVFGRALGQLITLRFSDVQVALAPEGGGDDRDQGGDGGEGEGQVQAVGERLRDQLGEERPAGDVGRSARCQLLQRPGRPEQFLDWVVAEESREQAADRRLVRDRVRGAGRDARAKNTSLLARCTGAWAGGRPGPA